MEEALRALDSSLTSWLEASFNLCASIDIAGVEYFHTMDIDRQRQFVVAATQVFDAFARNAKASRLRMVGPGSDQSEELLRLSLAVFLALQEHAVALERSAIVRGRSRMRSRTPPPHVQGQRSVVEGSVLGPSCSGRTLPGQAGCSGVREVLSSGGTVRVRTVSEPSSEEY